MGGLFQARIQNFPIHKPRIRVQNSKRKLPGYMQHAPSLDQREQSYAIRFLTDLGWCVGGVTSIAVPPLCKAGSILVGSERCSKHCLFRTSIRITASEPHEGPPEPSPGPVKHQVSEGFPKVWKDFGRFLKGFRS